MIVVTGLTGNNFLINNDIVINLSENDPDMIFVRTFSMTVTNLSSGESHNFEYTPKPDNTIRLSISDVIKAMFKNPSTSINYTLESLTFHNREVFDFTFTSVYDVAGNLSKTNSISIGDKIFLRGGKNTNNTNVTIPNNTRLRPTDILPYWEGFPTAEYTLTSLGIVKNPIMSSVINKERRNIKGCNPFYIKFLNTSGGFSYWLFEGQKEVKSNANIGYINNVNNKLDLGNDVSTEFDVFSRVPARFYPLIFDLIESPDIYLYYKDPTLNTAQKATTFWQKIISKNNKVTRDDFTKVYDVRLKFEKFSNYKPSVVW